MNQENTTKKVAIFIATIAIVFVFASCSKQQPALQNNQQGNDQNQQQIVDGSEGKQEGTENNNEVKPPNVDDWKMAEWKVYRDEDSGFEIQYPNSHFVDDKFRGDSFVYIRHSDTVRYREEIEGPYGVPEANLVQMAVYKNNKKLSLLDWLKSNNEYCLDCDRSGNNSCDLNCSLNKLDVSELHGKQVLLVEEPSMMDNEAVYFDLGDSIVKFHAQGLNLETNNGDNFFAKMLGTFKIIE